MMISENSSDIRLNEINIANPSYIASLVNVTGASEAAIKLLLSLFAGYPVAALHRCFIRKLTQPLQHIFFLSCGLFLCYFNYGLDCYHSLLAIWITYLLARLLRHTPKHFLIVNFLFHMSYLLIGYCYTESNSYDIIWTMPHCVLVLRLIGFSFDIADGLKPQEELSKDQKDTALAEVPSLLELAAYTYFPASFLVGPQFPFKRYRRFIQGKFDDCHGFIRAGVIRGSVGVLYLVMYQLGSIMLTDSYLLTDAFRNKPLMRKMFEIGIWGKVSLYKYISCWLLVEGALMCTAFTHAGKTTDGKDDWSGCSNVKLVLLETGSTMTHYVQSFNVNTNNWVAQYIYKRLKFLNNRMISYVAALGFLAVWHGFHSGYYMSFFMEFSIITMEKQIKVMYNKILSSSFGRTLNTSHVLYKIILFALLKVYNIVYMGWCLTPFILLNFDRWMHVFGSLNYFGFVVIGGWAIFYSICKYFGLLNVKEASALKSS